MASTEGGVEIEEVAAKHPEKILKEAVDPAVGFQAFQGRKLAFGLGLHRRLGGQVRQVLPGRSTTRTSRPTPRWRRSTRWCV